MQPDDREPKHRRPRSSNKTLFIILGVIGGLGLVMVAGCAGCGFWMFRAISTDIPPAQASADAFLADLQAGRIDVAYASTSGSFQSAQSLPQFREFVSRFATLKSHTSHSYDNSMIHHGTAGKQAVLKTTLRSPDNAMSCTLTVVQESGQWKVQGISVP